QPLSRAHTFSLSFPLIFPPPFLSSNLLSAPAPPSLTLSPTISSRGPVFLTCPPLLSLLLSSPADSVTRRGMFPFRRSFILRLISLHLNHFNSVHFCLSLSPQIYYLSLQSFALM